MRIAVAILCALAGLAVQILFRVDVGLAAGILVGLCAAHLVPAKTACPLRGQDEARGRRPDDAPASRN